MIRRYELSDVEEAKRIHSLYFKDEFNFPDFLQGYMTAFVVEDDKGVAMVAGIKPIAEAIIMTNKDRTPSERARVFYPTLDFIKYATNKHGFDQIHAFIHDPKWSQRLQKSFAFRPTKGQALVTDI